MTPIIGIVLLVLLVLILNRLNRLKRKSNPHAAASQATAEALRQSERRLRDYAEMASDWFWEQDADLRFTLVGIEAPLAETASQRYIGNQRWNSVDTTDEPEKWEQHKLDLMNRKPFRNFRYDLRGRDGTLRHVSINGIPVYDDAGTFQGYRGTGHDVTAQVEIEAELRRAKERAEEANRAKSAFLAQMSHELRTPLNAILGFSELIHDRTLGPLDEPYVEYAREIQVSGHKLLGAINNLIEMSQLEAGSYQLKEEPVEVERIIQACLYVAGVRAREAGVRIESPGNNNAQVILRADVAAMIQALLNVLTNAVKFTPAGGVVSWKAEIAAAGDLTFVVTDTGIGIDEAALPRIFEPFYQADSSNSRKFGGSGLGLAISRKLVGLHGGSLDVESEPGHGTTVRITLPASRILNSHPSESPSPGPIARKPTEGRQLPVDVRQSLGSADWEAPQTSAVTIKTEF